MLLALDQLDQCDVFGELRDIIAAEEDNDVIFWTLQAKLMIIFDDKCVKAAVAISVPASCQESWHVVAAVLIAA